ncbi:ATP-dependent Clp protease ATP-binding subunit [Salmonella enterica subsp. enterica]|uniref:ATP-dependent Clp protease ATP-binding subunit n=1 Tax=Salmonella enterica I TaxID=59201 RepID=A0A447U6B9_SALET|nr:ATP-dependent Clp protease ATP-binding subunit [Salmonella enterica subsp. enterica]
MTDNNGRKADFRNVVLVMTTKRWRARNPNVNLLVLFIRTTVPMRWARSRKCLRRSFRNRLDNIIWFDHLSGEVIHQVVDKFIVELQAQLDQKGVSLEVSQKRATGWRKRAMTGRWAHDQWRV